MFFFFFSSLNPTLHAKNFSPSTETAASDFYPQWRHASHCGQPNDPPLIYGSHGQNRETKDTQLWSLKEPTWTLVTFLPPNNSASPITNKNSILVSNIYVNNKEKKRILQNLGRAMEMAVMLYDSFSIQNARIVMRDCVMSLKLIHWKCNIFLYSLSISLLFNTMNTWMDEWI
jgi:hypothetical protein